jgi:phosphatidylinositol alpha 1,6-mannosyltransferase
MVCHAWCGGADVGVLHRAQSQASFKRKECTALMSNGGSMRAVHFAGTMRPGHDGVTQVLYRMTTSLSALGVDHMFVSPMVPPPSEQPVRMLEVPSMAFPLYRDYRLAAPRMRHFAGEVLDFRPDILHIHSPCSLGYSAVRFARKHHIPVVATYHTHFASYAKYYNFQVLEPFGWNYLRHIYGGCDAILVPSLPILDVLWDQGIRRLHYLPHGVDTNVFQPSLRSFEWRRVNGIPAGNQVLLYAGRLVREKDLSTLAKAYRLLKQKREDVTLVIAGNGPIKRELEPMVPGAVFLGHLDMSALATAYASSDIFVFPSTTETFGNVIVEAMASGLVPVCARAGGAAGTVQHGVTGLLTDPRDPADFASAVEFLLDFPAKRQAMALQSLEFARRQSWDTIFQRMLEVYGEVRETYKKKRSTRSRKAA